MGDLILYLSCEGSRRFKGTLQFIILLEIFFFFFIGGKLRLQLVRDHFPGIIIQSIHGGGTGLNTIAIGILKLPIDSVFFTLLCILKLSDLQIIFLDIALQGSLDDPSEVRGFLADPGDLVFLGIVQLQHL